MHRHIALVHGKVKQGVLEKQVGLVFIQQKNMTTSEGGMITTNDEAFADSCKVMRAHGMTAQYQHTEFGYNYRMTDISAAIGRVQLTKLQGFNARRREIANIYNDKLSKYVKVPENRRGHVYHQYTILCESRDDLRDHLLEAGVGSGIYYPTLLYDYEPMKDYVSDCPNAKKLTETALSLPVHPALKDEEYLKLLIPLYPFLNNFYILFHFQCKGVAHNDQNFIHFA